MDVNAPLSLLGGLSPTAFMRRHWQKKPLCVRQAWPGVRPPLARPALFDLAAGEDVESRLVRRDGQQWHLRHGPLSRRALPAIKTPGWTLLVQGLDLHVPAAREMLSRFRFLPDARLDDLMLSWASDGGGVGPHLDSYDVFLLQVQGRRRWRVGRVADHSLVPDVPLKILRHFEPEQTWLMEPGDLLYLPPGWGHDGVAEGGDCMTCSVGFRAPAAQALAAELLHRVADEAEHEDAGVGALYRDARQAATANPAALPEALQSFALTAVQRLLARPGEIGRALGEVLTEPKPQVWFQAGAVSSPDGAVGLAAASRMLYDQRHVFINGESYLASGRDAGLMRRLADERQLSARDRARLSQGARELLDDWQRHGWLKAGV